jgi:50S ribosomal protein L16 3-hydroxylase
MDVEHTQVLLGGLSPAQFMKRHWQKKPLLVRQAWPGVQAPLARPALFELASRDDVESRLVQCMRDDGTEQWRVRHGPLPRRALPPVSREGWTLLVQGLDLHVPAAHELLQRFRFIPDARLDDLMVSWASDGGGVGPHLDAYDVFLLQVQGRRRWRVGRVRQPQWVPGAPLKRLHHFEPEADWVLEPGDMLYLPPNWGHDGVALGGDCMTCSVGFRVPAQDELARDLLQRLGDEDVLPSPLYRDPQQPATLTPGAIPPQLQNFAQRAVAQRLADPRWLARALGETLSEPKAQVWFDATGAVWAGGAVRLSARTKMLYDPQHVFINGEAFEASGRDARLMRQLADQRQLAAAEVSRLSPPARALLGQWVAAGWAEGEDI